MVTRIMGACIILRCEFNYMSDRFEYQAISNKFELVPSGKVPPVYAWLISGSDIEAVKV